MKTGTVLLLGAAAVGLYEIAQLSTATKTINILFDGVKVNGPLNYTILLKVQNVSNAVIRCYAVEGDITLNGNDIGNASSFTEIDIQPRSVGDIALTVAPSILDIPEALAELISSPGQQYDFAISGNANIDTFVLPFTLTKSLTI